MTDLEISKALALAIGWPAEDITDNFDPPQVFTPLVGWRVFDYRDWDVIGPIAARLRLPDCVCDRSRVGLGVYVRVPCADWAGVDDGRYLIGETK